MFRKRHTAIAFSLVGLCTVTGATAAGFGDPNLAPFPNPTGFARTISTAGLIDTNNPFFRSLGTNGRSCATCHQPGDGWTITPAHVQARFDATGGTDPIFRPVDGADSPNADVSTVAARRAAYSMLLTKGLIRVGIGMPANAEFNLVGVDDPYHYASARDLSLFRRPLPATNLPFLSAVMWDGRETVSPIKGPDSGQALMADLMHQATDATLGHAQAAITPTQEQLQAIASFEIGLYTAQVRDDAAGDLQAAGARGGPEALRTTNFYIGINDPLGLNPTDTTFDPAAFTLDSAWSRLTGEDMSGIESTRTARDRAAGWPASGSVDARQSVTRGEAIFNTRQLAITGVGGLNDALRQPSITGTCTTCHDTPNVGNHSVAVPLNIGTADYPAHPGLDLSGMPIYTLRCTTTGATVQTTDPGRALISGKCADIGKFKGPILRDLAARAPYFHNGSAASLNDVVNFYNNRFDIGLSDQDKADLVAFLRTL